MSRNRLIGLASIAAMATFSVTPAVAQAGPRFYINGTLAGATKKNVVLYGTMTLSNALLGNIKCTVLAGATVANESERGVGDIEGYKTYDCYSEPACPGLFVTAEGPVEVTERENPVSKKLEKVAQRGPSTLPWSGEAVEEEGTEKLRKLKTHGMKLTIVAPCYSGEFPVEETFEPRIINGSKNGLKPTHLEVQGHGVILCEGGKCTEVEPPARLAMLGTMQQLVTAE